MQLPTNNYADLQKHQNYIPFKDIETTVVSDKYVCVCVCERERERDGERRLKRGRTNDFFKIINEGNGISTVHFYIQPSDKQSKTKYKLKLKTSY